MMTKCSIPHPHFCKAYMSENKNRIWALIILTNRNHLQPAYRDITIPRSSCPGRLSSIIICFRNFMKIHSRELLTIQHILFRIMAPFPEWKNNQLGLSIPCLVSKVCFHAPSSLCPPPLMTKYATYVIWSQSGPLPHHTERPPLKRGSHCDIPA